MEQLLTGIIVVGIVIVVALVINIVLPLLRKKGIDTDALLAKARYTIDVATEAIDTVRPFVAGALDVDTIDAVIEAANIGVDNAEQLLHIDKLDKDERQDAARAYALNTAALLGVEESPEIKVLIDGVIEAGAFRLGHKRN